jgi:CHAT domain-containing protein/tetratricopeptide (TPR) repeat protein
VNFQPKAIIPPSDKPVSALRPRMIDMAEKRHNYYIRHLKNSPTFLGRSPDTAKAGDGLRLPSKFPDCDTDIRRCGKSPCHGGSAVTVLIVLWLSCSTVVMAQHTDEYAPLSAQVERLYRQGKYAEAISVAERFVSTTRRRYGEQSGEYAVALNWLAFVYREQGRFGDTEPLLKRALAILEKALGSDDPGVAANLINLAELYRAQGRYGEAEPLYKRAIAALKKSLGPENPGLATGLGDLAELYDLQGRYAEAEPLLKNVLAILEKALGSNHPNVATALNNLAMLYDTLRRTDEAEPLYKRALAIREKALGPHHPDVAATLNNLASLYETLGRTDAAELLYKRALAIDDKALGPDHPGLATDLDNLAGLSYARGRDGEAEPLYKRALAIREKALGGDHPDVATTLDHLALLYDAEGRTDEAESLYRRALAIREKALGDDHPDVASTLNNLAGFYFERQDWMRAVEYWRRATATIALRVELGSAAVGQALVGRRKKETQANGDYFLGLIKAANRLAADDLSRVQSLSGETFETAQWAQSSEAAAALRQMAARGAKGDPKLAQIVRDRQELVVEWQQRDAALSAFAGRAPDKRDKTAEAANIARLTAINSRVAEIDKRLAADFPDYAALSRQQPLSVQEVQSELRSDEALVLFLDTRELSPTPEETFIWVITKTNERWVRSDLGTPSLERELAALRCGLDYDGTWGVLDSHCQDLLKINYTQTDHQNSTPLPFDRDRAHALYKALFGKIEDVIKDKRLLIVPSGALTQLPFQVLITEKPDTAANGEEAFRRAAWLVRKHALTVLPSVSSLKALRELAKDSHADRAMIGFGNPLLDGPDARYSTWASAARFKQSCTAPEQRIAALTGERRGVPPLDLRRGLAEVTQIRRQVPLPETADELCAVARDLRIGGDEIRLGARATEAEVKRLSAAGELSKYRMIHFATHGAIAGQVSGSFEPGLLLTPPDKATEVDDGYLSASEIAALKLDADWVILSACNTAAGGAKGAEALSGLARAFFYAGARALLVSHWAVYSDATVKLITGAVSRMAADKSVGRAEAMRQSMLAMIDKGQFFEAHPAFWAPFVVVGEGAAAK